VCIAVGGVVGIGQLGPGGLTVSGTADVSCDYEGAVHFCRLLETGTATFTVAENRPARQIKVIVAKASSPPKPSPACQGPMKITLNAFDSGSPAWWPLCLKVGSVLRLENLGPDALRVSPDGRVSCRYEAGVHECRFVKPGTVRFTINGAPEPALAVVVIK
jgi:hypothetical protein